MKEKRENPPTTQNFARDLILVLPARVCACMTCVKNPAFWKHRSIDGTKSGQLEARFGFLHFKTWREKCLGGLPFSLIFFPGGQIAWGSFSQLGGHKLEVMASRVKHISGYSKPLLWLFSFTQSSFVLA